MGHFQPEGLRVFAPLRENRRLIIISADVHAKTQIRKDAEFMNSVHTSNLIETDPLVAITNRLRFMLSLLYYSPNDEHHILRRRWDRHGFEVSA